MSKDDDYIKTRHTPSDSEGPMAPRAGEPRAALTLERLRDVIEALARLDWRGGLTREQIRRKCRALPEGIYLRLPDSKRFQSVTEVLHEAGIAPSRAEGEFLGAYPNIPAEESIAFGGPPAWGQQPAVFPQGASVDSGSAEDREGPLPEERRQQRSSE